MSTKINAFNESTNFWWGCTKVSPECLACYAESDCNTAGRGEEFHLKGWLLTGPPTKPFRIWGDNAPRMVRPRLGMWETAIKFDRVARGGGRRVRVFCNSMSDFFEDRPDLFEPRQRAWEIIRATPNVDWCILTKRHQNILACLPEDYKKKPWPNVWLGVSVGTQKMADERLKHLVPIMKDLKPVVFWLSVEPLLEEVHLEEYLDSGVVRWAFLGGESDQQPRTARPCHTLWAESVVKQFQSRKIPIHFKQWGSWKRVEKLKDAGLALGRDGLQVHKPLSKQGIAHLKEPCLLVHQKKAYAAGHEIMGKFLLESPKNYLSWKGHPEWNIKAKAWSLPGKYQPLKKGK